MKNLPPMCRSCYDILAEMYRLHQQLLHVQYLLQKQTELARGIVGKTRCPPKAGPSGTSGGQHDSFRLLLESPWLLFCSRIRASGMSSGQVEVTTKFVENLHDKIIAEATAKKQVIFPVGIPPDFVPEPGYAPLAPLPQPGRKPQQADKAIQVTPAPSPSILRRVTPVPTLSSGPVTSICSPPTSLGLVKPTRPILVVRRVTKVVPLPPPQQPKPPRPPLRVVGIEMECSEDEKEEVEAFEEKPEELDDLQCPFDDHGPDVETEAPEQKDLDLDLEEKDEDMFIPLPPQSEQNVSLRDPLSTDMPPPSQANSIRIRAQAQAQKNLNVTNVRRPRKQSFKQPEITVPQPQPVGKKKPTKATKAKSSIKVRPLPPVKITAITTQPCDLCGEHIRIPEIVKHLESHHVQDYLVNCPNPSCPYVFSCRGKLELHLKGDRRSRPFEEVTVKPRGSSICLVAANIPLGGPSMIKCDACDVSISKKSFPGHLQHHEYLLETKSLTCPMPNCGERYALKQSVDEHLMSHDLRPLQPPPDMKQECSECKIKIKLEDIAGHLKLAHSVEQVIPCKRCPFLFPTWESLLDHLYQHRSRTPGLTCDLCGDTDIDLRFERYDSLRQHFFNVHQIGSKFICEHCDCEFFWQPSLAVHNRNKHSIYGSKKVTQSVTKKQVKCDLCPSTFRVHSELLDHKIKMHDAPPVSCKYCSKTFLSVGSLQQHERTHLGLRRSYKCRAENCGKVFESMTQWKSHEINVHNPELKQFVCETCEKRFSHRYSLNVHVKDVHSGKKKKLERVICDICGESFAGHRSLKTHKLIHSGARPYKCEICNQAFRHTDVLKTHLKSHQEKGDKFKPSGPMKHIRKRVTRNE